MEPIKSLGQIGFELGREAYKRGAKPSPILDLKLMGELTLHYESNMLLINGWNRGYEEAKREAK